jgi:hypothetical protein
VVACREHYTACAPVLADDLVVIACNHGALPAGSVRLA